MAHNPDEIEALFRSRSAAAAAGGDENIDNEPFLSDEERTWRTAAMTEVLVAAREAWSHQGSEALDAIAEKLGNGSRDASWRAAMGESGLLNFFLNVLASEGLRQSLKIHALRLVGNSCADTDENRDRVVVSDQLKTVIRLLNDDAILAFVIPVLYNVCVDYEPAQVQACKHGLSRTLDEILSGSRLQQCRFYINIVCKILTLLVAHDAEASVANPALPLHLLCLATSTTDPPDSEEFCSLVSVALAYLAQEQFQTVFLAAAGGFELLQQTLCDSLVQLDLVAADSGEAAKIKRLWATFMQVFADMTYLPTFAVHYPMASPAVQKMVSWLGSPDSPTQLQVVACLSLGNLCRSDEPSMALVHHVHHSLSTMLTTAALPTTPSPASSSRTPPAAIPPGQLIHAALSFLKNLAIAPANKALLGSTLLDPAINSPPILPRLWTTTTTQPEIHLAAISLGRLLVCCGPNARLVCRPLSADPSSSTSHQTHLSILIGFSQTADSEQVRLEAARAVLAVCKHVHTLPLSTLFLPDKCVDASNTDHHALATFHATHPDAHKPLTFLFSQSAFPPLRSEALFVLALMSRCRHSVRVAEKVLRPFEAMRALVELVAGRGMFDRSALLSLQREAAAAEGELFVNENDIETVINEEANKNETQIETLEPQRQEQRLVDPAQAASLKRADRENGLVLVAGILRMGRECLPPTRRLIYDELLSKGGELILKERNGLCRAENKDVGSA